MRYDFECEPCGLVRSVDAKPFTPPKRVICTTCGQRMDRVFGCNIDTSSCRDADFIAPDKRVVAARDDGSLIHRTEAQGKRIERRYHQEVERKRELKGDRRVRRSGQHVMSHSIPAELHHGKIRETGDPNYWDDKKNLSRHKNWKV